METAGSVKMRGETGGGVPVRVLADEGRLRLLAGNELVGDWSVEELGIRSLNEGFSIRAEGEEFTLRVDDEAHLAEELGLAAASPRLARKVAALHNPEVEDEEQADVIAEPKTSILGVAFALAGLLIVLGGNFLRVAPDSAAAPQNGAESGGGGEFWVAFVIGGALMVGVSWILGVGRRWARITALGLMAGVVVLFGWVVSQTTSSSTHLTAYGFIAGGLVVGVAVLFGGGLRSSD